MKIYLFLALLFGSAWARAQLIPTFIDDTAALTSNNAVAFQFWIGLQDVNADGRPDIFVGTHTDTEPASSAMYLQENGQFVLFQNTGNYSQFRPTFTQFPRITGRYGFLNLTDNPEGLLSIYGQDADRAQSAFYPITGLDAQGRPLYGPKQISCRQQGCIPLDTNGDGALEFVAPNDLESVAGVANVKKPMIIHDMNGVTLDTLIPPPGTRIGHALAVFDADGDTYPDIVTPIERGYWSKSQWVADAFPESTLHHFTASGHSAALDCDKDGDLDYYLAQAHYALWSSTAKEAAPYGTAAPMNTYAHLFRNNGGTFTEITTTAGLSSPTLLGNDGYHTTYAGSFAADVNNDSNMDIVFVGERTQKQPTSNAPATAQAVTLLLGSGNCQFVVNRTTNFGNTGGRPWGDSADFNNDGLIDIVKLRNNTNAVALWRNTTVTTNHWLNVRVQGETTDGLHAAVTVRDSATDEIIGYQQVGIFSIASENLNPHFGLGTATQVDVTVQFPHDGPTYTHENLDVDRNIILRLNGDIVTNYQPGTNPLLAAADTTTPPDDEEPPPDEPTIEELQALILELEAEIVSLEQSVQYERSTVENLQAELAEAMQRAATLEEAFPVQMRRTLEGFEIVPAP